MQDDITQILDEVVEGDEIAMERLLDKYGHRLLGLVRKRLRTSARLGFDEDDVANDAWNSFFTRARDGQFPHLNSRDDLWKLLVTITCRKVRAYLKRAMAQKRRGGTFARGDSVFGCNDNDRGTPGFDQFAGDDPAPDAIKIMEENFEEALDRLGEEGERLRTVALYKFEGYSNDEIAVRIKYSPKTVERDLGKIRRLLASQVDG